MSIQITNLQAKVDSIKAELANYEAEKANLQVAIGAGTAGRGSSSKLKKIQGKIGRAQLRLGNAEKKLKIAMDAEALPSEPSPDASGSKEDTSKRNSMDIDNKPNQAVIEQAQRPDFNMEPSTGAAPDFESNTMDVDSNPFKKPTTSEDGSGGLAGGLNSSSDNASTAPLQLAVNAPSAGSALEMNSSQAQNFGVSPSFIFLPNYLAPTTVESSPPLQPAPPQPASVPKESNISFRDIDLEMEDDLNMKLITPDDKVKLQQSLFKSHFTAPKKSTQKTEKGVKFVDVSGSQDSGDSAIFYDDDDRDGNDAQPTRPAKPRVVLPDPNSNRGSQGRSIAAAPMRGQAKKDQVGGGVIAKGKKRQIDSKGEAAPSSKKEKIQGDDGEDDSGKDKEEYHPSEYSVAKAARAATQLAKQRARLADEVNHRKFLEEWLDARSKAERPELPDGIELVRFDPDYLPAVATANYDLAIELLFNQSNNYLCIPHIKLNRKLTGQVDNLQGPVRIWGTPLPRNQNSNSSSHIPRELDHFHCGCHEKVALAGFVMWKTWKARAMINGKLVVEGLHQHQPFHPREVVFILQFLKSKFGYTVEDMFTGSSDHEEEARKEAEVMKKVANFCARRHYELIGQEMTLDTNFSDTLEEELAVPQWI